MLLSGIVLYGQANILLKITKISKTGRAVNVYTYILTHIHTYTPYSAMYNAHCFAQIFEGK